MYDNGSTFRKISDLFGISEARVRLIYIREKAELQKKSGKGGEKLIRYYQNCQALVFPQEEDFGLTAIEAQACGKPVIAFNAGGAKESVTAGKTGELYDSQTEDSLISAIENFQRGYYSSSLCRKNSLRFSKEILKKKMKVTVEKYWSSWKKKL